MKGSIDEIAFTYIHDKFDELGKKIDNHSESIEKLAKSHYLFKGKVMGASLILSLMAGMFGSYIVWVIQK